MLARAEPRTGRHRRGGVYAGSAPVAAGQHVPISSIRPSGPDPAAPPARRGATRFTWRRLLAATSVLACALTVYSTATGTTFGRFSASRTSGSNSFSAGTVTLANSAIQSCPVSGLLPNTLASCTFTATYSGSVPAYLAVDVLIQTQAGSGGTTLYNPADPTHDLQVTIMSSSPSVAYTVPATATTCPGGAPTGSSCYELDNELIATTAQTSAAVTFSISVNVPNGSTTGYQGGAAQIILTTHAVQSKNNTLSCSATPTAGSPCTPTGSFSWS